MKLPLRIVAILIGGVFIGFCAAGAGIEPEWSVALAGVVVGVALYRCTLPEPTRPPVDI